MKQLSKTFVWILMGMLIVGLAGFGAVNFTSSATAVAIVGDEEVSINDYARELQREQRALQAQTGQAMTISQLVELGMDRAVLSQLVSIAAIDNEVSRIGISTGDHNLQREISQIDAFQGINGQFDREAYAFALQNAGLSEREFEEDIRKETARTILQGSVLSGVKMPALLKDTLLDYVGARRSFSYVLLDADTVVLTAEVPETAELRAFYDENIADFTLPETKVITYVHLTPEMMLEEVEVDDAAIQTLFDQRSAEYQQPERRLVERLVFGDQASADHAKAQLDLGGTLFETLVADRGLTLQDVDLGDVTIDALDDAGDAIFAADVDAVVGPLPSDLGPALYRVNGKLAARNTTLDEVRDVLQREVASDRARRLVEARAEDLEDLLAGGTTLEELADSDGLALATLNWTTVSSDDIAAYEGFRARAAAVTVDDFPTIDFLDDGSIYAVRLDEVLPPRPAQFDTIENDVLAAWQAQRTQAALAEQAEALMQAAQAADDFAEDAEVVTETGLTRTAYLDQTPATLVNDVFDMNVGEYRVIAGTENTAVVRLDALLEPSQNDELELLSSAIEAQLDQALASALFDALATDLRIKAEPRVNEQALSAVQANFH